MPITSCYNSRQPKSLYASYINSSIISRQVKAYRPSVKSAGVLQLILSTVDVVC